jgi:hypothetical protein
MLLTDRLNQKFLACGKNTSVTNKTKLLVNSMDAVDVRPFAEQQKSQTKYSLSVCYEKRMSRESFKLLQKCVC